MPQQWKATMELVSGDVTEMDGQRFEVARVEGHTVYFADGSKTDGPGDDAPVWLIVDSRWSNRYGIA